MKHGPNVRKLIIHKMSLDAIPTDSKSGLADGIKFLSDTARIAESAKVSAQWVETALFAIRSAEDPNPWRNMDDEAIADHLMKKIEEKRSKLP